MKWTLEQKMAWIKAYKNRGTVPKPEDFRNSQKRWHDKIRNWIHVLEEFGEDGPKHLGTRAFKAGEKLAAVLRVEGGESLAAAGHSLGMPCPSSVLAWVRAYREKGADGLESRPKGRIAAYGLSLRPDLSQTKRMLGAAFSLGYGLKGLIFHSDQGWQYQHRWYVESLKRRGILQSMSRKGNCLDNCIMESFFGTMKNEMYCGCQAEYGSFETFAKAVGEYIAWYNGTRIRYQKCMKKWMTPLACFEASFGGHPCGAPL